jgi:hypothetical protein
MPTPAVTVGVDSVAIGLDGAVGNGVKALELVSFLCNSVGNCTHSYQLSFLVRKREYNIRQMNLSQC